MCLFIKQCFLNCTFKANENGDYFPIWGTCMGFQLLTALPTGKDLLSPSDSEDLHIPLELSAGT